MQFNCLVVRLLETRDPFLGPLFPPDKATLKWLIVNNSSRISRTRRKGGFKNRSRAMRSIYG